MAKKKFKAESKRLLDLMINSIYTHKEIFLRELISNASDAIDKLYYKALTDDSISFNKDDYYIRIVPDKETRTLRVIDTGIGMTKEELDDNLGVIAQSGSLQFKNEHEEEQQDAVEIIGQFGVGFYSAFMVAQTVTVQTKPYGSDTAYQWQSKDADGYTIKEIEKDTPGTEIILTLKENTDDENYDEFLEEYRLKELIKRYSDFIRYPIKMEVTETVPKEGEKEEYETVTEEETINSMVPIWRKNKSELTEEDYNNFYAEKHYGFDTPLAHIHIKAEGLVRYNSILFIPEQAPYDFYTRNFEKGLELYSNGVMIMERCADLLPDYFAFVRGMVESDDLSLNISREILQHDRQLKLIAKNIKNKVKAELERLLKDQREDYEKFFTAFGRQLKYGIYTSYGADKDDLQDLLLFASTSEEKPVTLDEYVTRMKEDQKYIYYASGESVEKIKKMPQTEMLADKGYEILCFTDDVDEFAIRMLMNYKEKEFKSVSGGDLGIEDKEVEEETKAEEAADQPLLEAMKETLGDRVKDVRLSKRLKSHPVCIVSDGDITVEMERVLNMMPDAPGVSAQKILEINPNHPVFEALKKEQETDPEKVRLYTELLYNQALLMEGLTVADPLAFSNDICKLME